MSIDQSASTGSPQFQDKYINQFYRSNDLKLPAVKFYMFSSGSSSLKEQNKVIRSNSDTRDLLKFTIDQMNFDDITLYTSSRFIVGQDDIYWSVKN